MTWSGESDTTGSGIYTYRDDGSPGNLVGLDSQIVMWSGGAPTFVEQSAITGVADGDFIEHIKASGAGASAYGVESSTSYSSTVGITYSVIPGTTITTPASGEYFCSFNADISADKSNKELRFAIFVDGVIVDSSERDITSQSAGQRAILSTSALATVDGTQSVDVRWRRVGSSALWTIDGRTLGMIKVINNT